jgi:hypothetical protein
MTKIHMETEEVRETAHLLDLTSFELYYMPFKLRGLAGSISGAWQGGKSGQYAGELRRHAEILQREVINLQRLAVRVANEVNEWELADNNGARTIMPEFGFLLPGAGVLVPMLPASMAFQNLSLTNGYPGTGGETSLVKDWEAGLDVTFSDKWTSGSGWEEDAEIGAEAKISLMDGAYAEGKGSSNWQLGRYDIGGAVGEYGVSQGEAGAQFGVGEDGFIAGAYGEYDAVAVSGGAVLGGSLLGLTVSAGGSAGSAEGFVGYKEGTVGASLGASAVAGEVGVGLNVAGANVGVKAGASVGFELGVKLGAETEIKAGPFKIGLSFGKAITD